MSNKYIKSDFRSLEMHCLIADKIKENPQLIEIAKNNLSKWRTSYGNKPIPYYIVEWEVLLQKPIYQVLKFLRSTTQLAQQLRSSTPFVGILTEEERLAIFDKYKNN